MGEGFGFETKLTFSKKKNKHTHTHIHTGRLTNYRTMQLINFNDIQGYLVRLLNNLKTTPISDRT